MSLSGSLSAINSRRMRILSLALMSLVLIFVTSLSYGYTDDRDVYAINSLYAALGSPVLPGWITNGGDPCLEGWQGVQCVGSNITAIILSGANLGGQLGDNLGNFTSIITIDFSNNNIGGSIPESLPITMREFFLSANQFTGSIPSSLSGLTFLSAMSMNSNHLIGELPDSFQSLTDLVNLDLSSNNFSGQLPPSMENLSSLTSLHLQNNQLSGLLNVLEDLPLKDLNIANNLFSGPVPVKLLNVPNFIRDGNPFNTTIAPSPMLPPASPHTARAPAPKSMHANTTGGHGAKNIGHSARNSNTSIIRIIIYAVVAVVLVIVALLLFCCCISKCQQRKARLEEGGERGRLMEQRSSERVFMPNYEAKKIPGESANYLKRDPDTGTRAVPKKASEHTEHAVDVRGPGMLVMPPPAERVIVKPIVPPGNAKRNTQRENASHPNASHPSPVASFSVASLQQYTNSFSEENMLRECRLGKVYLAQLTDGKLLTVLKLDSASSKLPVDEFLELVLGISELKHPNVLELVGYCAEFGQRLLVYNYFSKTTLHDVLHFGDDLKRKLSWNVRLQVAVGAAKALEYLHEGCRPSVVHQNFEPTNILLNDELMVRVTECGLASLLSSNSVAQLSGRMRAMFSYEAPEVSESKSQTDRSDVYSFGVVMLELLTGRQPYDSSRPRGEQHLVRWASSQLHDINALSRMVDPCIQGTYPVKSLSRFADIISRCIQQGAEFRPPMSEVVQDLARMVEDTRKGG